MDDQHLNVLKFIRVYGCYLSKIERSYRFCISELNENEEDNENNQILFFLMKLNSLFSIHNQNLSAKNKVFEVDDIIAILFDYLKKQDDTNTKTIFCNDSFQFISVTIKENNLMEIIKDFEKNLQNNNCFTINIKYSSNEFSIIQIVQNKEQLGNKAITKAKLPQFLLLESDDSSNAVKQKKEKAEKMKESIMNAYKNRLDNFQISEGNKTGIIR